MQEAYGFDLTAGLLGGLEKFSPSKIRRHASSAKLQVHNTALMSAGSVYARDELRAKPVMWGRWVESAVGMAVIRQLIDRGSLVKVQDEKGHAIENLGDWGGWHNSIGTFRSGEGYRIHVSQPDTLTIFPSYPEPVE